MPFQVYQNTILWRNTIQRQSVTRPKEAAYTKRNATSNINKELQSFFSIMNYLGKFSHSTAEVYEPLRKLTSSKCMWTWKNTCQSLYNRAKNIIKMNMTMVFYNEKAQLYLETEASGEGLGVSLLQVRDRMQFPRNEAPDNAVLWPIAFVSKSLTNAETCYSNI